MTAEELAAKFNAKGRKWPRRAVCPVHTRPGTRHPALTLAIYADEDAGRVWCPVGCPPDDILAAVGLTWKDCLYRTEWLPPKEYREQQRRKFDEAEKERQRKLDARRWEAIANLLHAHLIAAIDTPDEQRIGRLWRKALATARAKGDAQCYRMTKIPNMLTDRLVNDGTWHGYFEWEPLIQRHHLPKEIAEVLGL